MAVFIGLFVLAIAREQPPSGALTIVQTEDGVAKVVLSVVTRGKQAHTQFGRMDRIVGLRGPSLFAQELTLEEAQQVLGNPKFPFTIDGNRLALSVGSTHAISIPHVRRVDYTIQFPARAEPAITAPHLLVWTSVARTRARIPGGVTRFYAKIPSQPEGGYWLYRLYAPLGNFDVDVLLPRAAKIDVEPGLAKEIVLEKLQGFNIAVLEPNTLSPVVFTFKVSDAVSALGPQ